MTACIQDMTDAPFRAVRIIIKSIQTENSRCMERFPGKVLRKELMSGKQQKSDATIHVPAAAGKNINAAAEGKKEAVNGNGFFLEIMIRLRK